MYSASAEPLKWADLVDFGLHDGYTQLAHLIGRLALADPEWIVHQTQDELAQMTGLSRQQVTQLLGKLRDGGHVRYERYQHGIRVPDPRHLANLNRGA